MMVGRLFVTSGFRCPNLNREVGGRISSRHVLSLAADVISLDCTIEETMATIGRAFAAGALLDCDEAIREMGWIHIQAAPRGIPPRHLLLATDDGIRFKPYERALA